MLPVRPDDALSDGVSDLVENVLVVCTADEELILEEKQTNTFIRRENTGYNF